MSSQRRNLALPDGWRPTVHTTVTVLASTTLHPVDVTVPGRWRSIEKAPDGGWWLQPADDTAQAWLDAAGRAAGTASGCVNVHHLRLVPWWTQPTLPE